MNEQVEYSELHKKNALVYIRYATKAQSKMIPDWQDSIIQQFCAKHKIDVHGTYSDICSGRLIFNSLSWNLIERYVATYPGRVQFIIVAKMDRISRKESEVTKKQAFFKRLGVTIVSVDQCDLIIQSFNEHYLN